MTRTFLPLIVLLQALTFVAVADAGPIIYFDNYRSLDAKGMFFETSAAGGWSASTGTGLNNTHSSFIGESVTSSQGIQYERIRAHTAVLHSHSRVSGYGDASTDLFTSFALDVPHTVDLNAFVSARDYGYAEGFFFNETTQTMLAQVAVNDSIRRMQYQGVLEPGVYSYFLRAEITVGEGFHESTAQFGGDLNLTPPAPVPEPATMTLFGVGLAAAWRLRKQRSV